VPGLAVAGAAGTDVTGVVAADAGIAARLPDVTHLAASPADAAAAAQRGRTSGAEDRQAHCQR
jgi:hypothetical protein